MDKVQICNMGLARVSGEPISDIDDFTDGASKSAALCRTFFDPLRDIVLRATKPQFAIFRQSLTAVTPSVLTLTARVYAYQLPTDPYCLRALEVYSAALVPSVLPWDLEGRIIYTDEYNAYLRYVARVEDPQEWDAAFVDAFAWRLAAEVDKPINGSSDGYAALMYKQAVLESYGLSEQEAKEPEAASTRWIDERGT